MPRYFFDLRNHENIPDHQGTECAGDDAARAAAIVFAGEYLRDHPELVWNGRKIRVHVQAEARTPMFMVLVLGVDLRSSFPRLVE